MDAHYTLRATELRGGALLRWLVQDGSAVREEQPLAEYHAQTSAAGARPVVMTLRAPVMGTLTIQAQSPSAPGSGTAGSNTAAGGGGALLGNIRVCTHSMLFGGTLCALCGTDVTKLPRRTREFLDEHREQQQAGAHAHAGAPSSTTHGRAPSSSSSSSRSAAAGSGGVAAAGSGRGPAHDFSGMEKYKVQHGFEISMSDAHVRAADEAQADRLRSSRRLSLLLDLDHTLVHATNDPRAAAVLSVVGAPPDVHFFQDELFAYHVKLRPGVERFLAEASTMYELQVDTAGTRAYAQRVVTALDPTGALFGNRIVSRCDSRIRHKQTSWLHRSLKDDSMVVIVDDTEAVWRGSRNLLLIEPYHFWLGSDVNNSAGTSVADISGRPPPAPSVPSGSGKGGGIAGAGAAPEPNGQVSGAHGPPLGAAASVPSPLRPATLLSPSLGGELVEPSGSAASSCRAAAAAPLGGGLGPKEARQLIAEVAAEETHHYLDDMLRLLREIHTRYYRELDAGAAATARVSANNTSSSNGGGASAAPPPFPRTDEIISDIMHDILADVCICFSGVFPLNCIVSKTPLWRRCIQFGACMSEAVGATSVHPSSSPDHPLLQAAPARPPRAAITTHLVARVPGTSKFSEALAAQNVRVVQLEWLEESLKRYCRQPETEYAFPGQAAQRAAGADISLRVQALRAATVGVSAVSSAASYEGARVGGTEKRKRGSFGEEGSAPSAGSNGGPSVHHSGSTSPSPGGPAAARHSPAEGSAAVSAGSGGLDPGSDAVMREAVAAVGSGGGGAAGSGLLLQSAAQLRDEQGDLELESDSGSVGGNNVAVDADASSDGDDAFAEELEAAWDGSRPPPPPFPPLLMTLMIWTMHPPPSTLTLALNRLK